MSCLLACFRDRGPHAETEAMKRQGCVQEHEIIELREDNTEDSEAGHDKPPNAQTRKETGHWRSCTNVVFWKCKLWMVIATIFLVFFLVILISLILYSNVYTDEDDYWDADALLNSGNCRSFLGTLELMCDLPHLGSEDITKKLEFSVPPPTEGFMENTMNPDFIKNVLRQNIYDEDDISNPGTLECNKLKFDPTSLTLT
ncbi:TPA-induced transmembrane protein isoform X3 [Pezoporus occidentalis]|uniref:TPA-induced transmembrane protein isoform X3 n=1 Tax=Pezoporus occidentalis TaxID=407982 RepID=UPI002F911582